MTSEIQVFDFQDNVVRIVERNGEPWFVAKDVCDYFGDTNRSRTMQGLSDDQKGYTQTTTPGGIQTMAIVNEAGLYAMLFSMQPEKGRGITDEYIAERQNKISTFKQWVFEQVLPSIRKHGVYMAPERAEPLLNSDFIIPRTLPEALRLAADLAEKVQQDAPKVLFADAVSTSHTDILVGDLAKILHQNGIDIGQKRLFEFLRNEGYLMKYGVSRNMPTQRSMELGIFRVKETTITKPDGSTLISRTVKVTGKGQVYFVNYFLKRKLALVA